MAKKNVLFRLLAAVAMLGTGHLHAETFGEMRERLNAMEAQQEELQRESQVAAARLAAEQAKQRLSEAQGASNNGPMPSILAIMQVNSTWLAKLQNHDGVVETYVVGDPVGQGVITSIGQGGVVVSERKQGKTSQSKLRYLAPAQVSMRTSGNSPVTLQPPSLWDSLPRIPALEQAITPTAQQ